MRAHDHLVAGIVAVSLACAGLMDPLAPIGLPPVAESPAENPLVLDQRYVYAADAETNPEWVDQAFLFRADGTCEHELESAHPCTWAATVKGGIWSVEITGYPDRVPLPVGTKLEVATDGRRLIGKGGQPFVLTPPG